MRLGVAIDKFFISRAPRKDSPHTTAAYRRDLAAVSRHIAEVNTCSLDAVAVSDASVSVLREAFARFSSTRSKSSIARAWSVWNAFFGFCVTEGLIEGNPMQGVSRPRPPRRLPKPLRGEDAAERLLEGVAHGARVARFPWPQRDLAVIAVLLLTGVRSSELLCLRVGDVAGDAGDRRLMVRGGKGGHDRVIPVDAPLDVVLETYAISRRDRLGGVWPLPADTALFVDHRGGALTRNQLQYLVRQCYRFAGVGDTVEKGALVHALRHTFATRLGQSGASAVEVMELLGHRSLAASQSYMAVTGSQLRDAARANPMYGSVRRIVDGGLGVGESWCEGGDGVVGAGDEW